MGTWNRKEKISLKVKDWSLTVCSRNGGERKLGIIKLGSWSLDLWKESSVGKYKSGIDDEENFIWMWIEKGTRDWETSQKSGNWRALVDEKRDRLKGSWSWSCRVRNRCFFGSEELIETEDRWLGLFVQSVKETPMTFNDLLQVCIVK